jgi:hypothetical protein
MSHLAGFEPGIIGIVLYLIITALFNNKKKQAKLQKKGKSNTSSPIGEKVSSLFENLQNELTDKFENIDNVFNQHELPSEEIPIGGGFTIASEPTVSEPVPSTINNSITAEDIINDDFFQKEKEFYDKYSSAATVESSRNSIDELPVLRSIKKMNVLKQAIIWQEIIGKPISLRKPDQS